MFAVESEWGSVNLLFLFTSNDEFGLQISTDTDYKLKENENYLFFSYASYKLIPAGHFPGNNMTSSIAMSPL